MTDLLIQAFHVARGENLPPTRGVIHSTNPPQPKGQPWYWASQPGQARSTGRYFQSAGSGGSAHHAYDISEGVRCGTDSQILWHAPPNPHSIGYEICGQASYTREQWLDPHVWPAVVRCAAQVKADARQYGWDTSRRLTPTDLRGGAGGLCGHIDVAEAWHQSDHTDPGAEFPWDRFLALLNDINPIPVPEDFVMASKAELEALLEQQTQIITGGVRPADKHDTDSQHVSNADVLSALERFAANVDTRLKALEAK